VIIYIYEPILNSELVLTNNSKKLKLNPDLLYEEYIPKIKSLREEFILLEQRSEAGEIGLQKEKKKIRDEIRILSSRTYTTRTNAEFGKMIILIIDRIASRPQFSGYTYLDEMKSLAVEHIMSYSHGFDPFRTSKISGQYASAFAYISTIAFNAFIATINKFKRNQAKAKEDFLETQKLIHREANCSTYGPEFENASRKITYIHLEPGELNKKLHETTITEATDFWIPADYKITQKEMDFVLKYEYNISIRRLSCIK